MSKPVRLTTRIGQIVVMATNPTSTPDSLRVAVASKEGLAVSEHFGHAKHFLIYQLTPQGAQLLEERQVPHYCLGGTSDKAAMPQIIETIHDCAAVLVAKIGDGPTEKLAAVDIRAVADYAWEPIEEALADFASQLSGTA